MNDIHHVASVVLINPKGKLLFQKRDDNPDIRHPGMITVWGGAVEKDETPLQAAVREICEETNLRPHEDDFIFLKDYPRRYQVRGQRVVCHVFLLRNVDEHSLQVYEGQGYVLVDGPSDKDNPSIPISQKS